MHSLSIACKRLSQSSSHKVYKEYINEANKCRKNIEETKRKSRWFQNISIRKKEKACPFFDTQSSTAPYTGTLLSENCLTTPRMWRSKASRFLLDA